MQRYSGKVIVVIVACVARLAAGQDDQTNQQAGPDPALRGYFAGNGLLNRGQYEAAIAEYRTFLADHPKHEKASVARYGLVVSLFRLERCAEALSELAGLREIADFSYAAEIGMIEGQCLLSGQRFDEAAEVFENIASRYEKNELADDAAALACEARTRGGDFEKALGACQSVASKWPESSALARSEFFKALAQVGRKEFSAASQTLIEYEKKFPKSEFGGQVPLLLAQCYQRENNADQALQRYAAVAKTGDEAQMPDALLGLGTMLYQVKKYAEAGKALDTLVAKYPDTPAGKAAILQRAHVWFALGEFDKALTMFERAGKADSAIAAEASFWAAKCELRKGDYSASGKRLAAAIAEYPSNPLRPEMEYDRAVALMRGQQLDEAAQALNQFLERHADHRLTADALQLSAACEHQRGKYELSTARCAQFTKRFPAHEAMASVVFLAAENAFLGTKFQEAKQGYEAFLEKFPQDAKADEARFRLGMTLYHTQEFDQAAKYFEQVAAKAKENEFFRPGLLALGDIAFQRGEWKTAQQRLDEYLKVNPESDSAHDALMKRAYSLQKQERSEEALRGYAQLVEKYPQSPHCTQAHFESGQILISLNQPQRAEGAFQRALKSDPEGRFAQPTLGHLAALASQRGAHEEAAAYYEREALKDTNSEGGNSALLRQGQSLMAAGKPAQAEAVFRKVKTAEGEVRLAIALARQDRHQDALDLISRIDASELALLPAQLRQGVYYEKAWSLRALNRNDQVTETYRKLIADPEGGDLRLSAMLELAELDAAAKRFKEAAEVLRILQSELASRPAPEEHLVAQSLFRLGLCEFELQDFSKAADLFEQYAKQFPKGELLPSSLFYAGEALFRAGRSDRAARYLTRVVEEHSSSEFAAPAMLRLGECHAAAGKWALSEEVLLKFLERYPDSPQWFQAQFGIGWSRENQKRFEEAMSSYERVTAGHQGPTAARAQFQIGQCHFAKKDYAVAIRELLKVDILYAYPEWSAAALYEAGRCFALTNDAASARQQFVTVTEKFKETKWADMAAKQLAELRASAAVPGS